MLYIQWDIYISFVSYHLVYDSSDGSTIQLYHFVIFWEQVTGFFFFCFSGMLVGIVAFVIASWIWGYTMLGEGYTDRGVQCAAGQ